MFRIFSIAIFVVFFGWLKAQSISPEVVASSGNFFDDGSVNLSWTLGEIATESIADANHLITQGFQQTFLLAVSVAAAEKNDFSILLYPNPTVNDVTLAFSNSDESEYEIKVYNHLGQNIFFKNILTSNMQKNFFTLNLGDFASGQYMIEIAQKNKTLKTFKVQKIH